MPKKTLTDPYIKGLDPPQKRVEISDQTKNGEPTGVVLRISKTGHKSFVYRYRYGKSVKRYTIGSYPKMKLAKARRKVGELEDMLAAGIDPLAEKKRKKNAPAPVSVSGLADLFIEKHLPKLKKTTQESYKRRINSIKNELGSIPAEELNRSDIIAFLEDVLEAGAPIQSA